MVNGKPDILVVEDDIPIRNLIMTTLDTQDYKYQTASDGKEALLVAVSHQPDIFLMDLGLPDMDGIEVIKKIRTWSVAPIIVISARSDDKDKIEALDAGADDYLTKPFSVEELLARIRSTLRRLQYLENKGTQIETIFENGDLSIDYTSATVKVGEEVVHLMPMEYNLLCLLAKNVGKVLTHQYILDKVWINAIESDLSSLRVYMATLRKKIEQDKTKEKYIQTRIGIGYGMVRIEKNKIN
ncbi:response regulator transcription factor [Niameybacter massiliensis]|uniref:Stage 0 sporulation protein A homolog n=1 Tax=Holtiella tumoricola TaxID=3018743 RepID=A0AA42DLM7_9FIRM|nr:response regulator transcription factor [Holtiella tumoricola]MDA3731309.1 response regulator transcription factor [Holtiella tumoricola]